MKPILKYTLLGLLIAILAGVSVSGIAYAQGDDPRGRGALAELLGLTCDELKSALEDGKTVQELADETGVDLETYHDDMQLTRQVEMETRIEEALAIGEITQKHADWLREGLDNGFLNGPFFRFGSRGDGDFGCRPGLDKEGFPGMRDRE